MAEHTVRRAAKPVNPFVPLTIHAEYAVVFLTQGKFAIVDPEDWERVSVYKWHTFKWKGRDNYYARVANKYDKFFLHQFILPPPPGMEIDHINRNGLDNRKANLRVATKSQNCMNRVRLNSTGFRGVRRQSSGGYQAMIRVGGKSFALGTYRTAAVAAQAYDDAARKHHGEFAVLNFPPKLMVHVPPADDYEQQPERKTA